MKQGGPSFCCVIIKVGRRRRPKENRDRFELNTEGKTSDK